jgi:hypothetical protein
MEAIYPSTCKIWRWHNPEDQDLNTYRREYLEAYVG